MKSRVAAVSAVLLVLGGVAFAQEEVFPAGSVGAARAQLASLEFGRGYDLRGTTPRVISGASGIELLTSTCPNRGGSVPFDVFGPELDALIYDHLRGEGANAIDLNTTERMLFFSFENNSRLQSYTGTYHAMLTLSPAVLCGGYVGKGENKAGEKGKLCGRCATSETESCSTCGTAQWLAGDETLVRTLEVGTILPNWNY